MTNKSKEKFTNRLLELFDSNIGKNINAQGGRKLKKSEVMQTLNGCIERTFEEYDVNWKVDF